VVELLNNFADVVLFFADVAFHAYFPANPVNLQFSFTFTAFHKKSLISINFKNAAVFHYCPGGFFTRSGEPRKKKRLLGIMCHIVAAVSNQKYTTL
jgi:hypothetical protein